MVEGELKLLGAWASSYAIRVRMVLEQKGISYEYLEQDIINKSELLLKHNPIHKKVPVLIHNDRSICESLVILQYIDEKWSGTGPPVLPLDPYERAVARFWAVYIDDKLIPSWFGILKAATEETKVAKIGDTLAALELLEGAFKKCSTGKCFFGGDSIGFVDVILGCQLTWMKAVENIVGVKLVDETTVPLLVEWEKRFLAADFVKRVLPSVERIEELARMLRATIWNVDSAN
ncbi:putative glutathione S-transferase GSTU6 [Carex littledalei]|uniref:glutathione transferase n=1 Tax=Carex littledalei TaxID=544730 RepID=A0A833RH54_9POAL|nr:putative glutathione S-transferase GSTU6 [Carex littledalei]